MADHLFNLGVSHRITLSDRCSGVYHRDGARMAARPTGLYDRITGGDPSVIYGLWAVFVLVPLLRKFVEPWLHKYWGWSGLFEGPPLGIGMLAAESSGNHGSADLFPLSPRSHDCGPSATT